MCLFLHFARISLMALKKGFKGTLSTNGGSQAWSRKKAYGITKDKFKRISSSPDSCSYS
jgi:hypothetical protein